MSGTIIEIFVKVTPLNLFRSGTKNSPRLDKLRTMPPRISGQAFDVKIYEKMGEHTSIRSLAEYLRSTEK